MMMNKVKLLCLASLWLASIASAVNVEGSIVWDFKCKDLDELHPQSKVVLDGGRYKASILESGKFTLFNVPPGSYLLEVLARDHEFDPLRVEVLSVPQVSGSPQLTAVSDKATSAAAAESTTTASGVQTSTTNGDNEEPPLIPSTSPHSHIVSGQQLVEVEIRPAPPGTPFHPAGSPHLQALPLLPYPIALSSRGRKVYDVAQKGFDVLEMFKNPMMLMMLVAGALVFILPKALESMDPDIVKDMRERQDKMFNLQNSIQNGDFGALKAELTQRVSEASSSSTAKPRAVTDAASNSSGPSQQAVAAPGSGKKSGGRKKR